MKFSTSQIMSNSQVRSESPSFQKMQALADIVYDPFISIINGLNQKLEQIEINLKKKKLLMHLSKRLIAYQIMIKLRMKIGLKYSKNKFQNQVTKLIMKNLEKNIMLVIKNNYNNSKSQLINNQMMKKIKRRVEMQLLKQIEDRFDTVHGMLEKNNSIYYEKLNRQIGDVSNQLKELRYTIENEQQTRSDSQAHLIEQMDLELNKFQEMMSIERSVREETEKKIFSMIEDVHSKIQSEIQAEIQQKEKSHESILRLLEQTCIKIDESFNQ